MHIKAFHYLKYSRDSYIVLLSISKIMIIIYISLKNFKCNERYIQASKEVLFEK